MKILHLAVPSVTAILVIATAAGAHHGWSSYDSTKEMTLDGVIKESGYEHPHGHVKLEVSGKTWQVVLAPPSRMTNRGLPAEMLKPGTKARAVGYPSKTDPSELRAERITIGDKTVELR